MKTGTAFVSLGFVGVVGLVELEGLDWRMEVSEAAALPDEVLCDV